MADQDQLCINAIRMLSIDAVQKADSGHPLALVEDGPTPEPVEQLAGRRAMPNMMILRPSDATETGEAWVRRPAAYGRSCRARAHAAGSCLCQ